MFCLITDRGSMERLQNPVGKICAEAVIHERKRMLKRINAYFSKGDITLWFTSVMLVAVSFLLFDRENYLTLTASLIGVTSLIFNAKGNPVGQLLMIAFSLIYGIISFSFSYYGEMITYIGMTMPMAVIAFISWLRNPFNGSHSEVKVGRISKAEIIFMLVLTVIVTVLFYYILRHFHTANLLPSTLSVTTSFIAVYLTFRRIPFFAVAYAANDIVLMILWSLASIEDIHYISVLVCFTVFLFNDLYGFRCWQKMKNKQAEQCVNEIA